MRRLYNGRADVGKIWNTRGFLHPNMHVLGDGKHSINPSTYIQKVRNKFFPLSADIRVVEREFLRALNRGSTTLNSLLETHLSGADSSPFKVGFFPEQINVEELIKEARKRYRALEDLKSADPTNKRSLYEVIRGLEIAHHVFRIDTEKEVQLSLRYYKTLIAWFNEFLDIKSIVSSGLGPCPCSFLTGSSVEVYGYENSPFRSRIKYLTSEGEIKYESLLMKLYLDLLESNHITKNIKDYTGVEFIVLTDADVEQLVERFRDTSPTGLLEGFKQRKRISSIQDNIHTSSVFGLTKFILRIPILVDPIDGHPLRDLICQTLPVEVQILTLDDYNIRETHPDARHERYKQRQFMAIFPAIFPKEIYRPFLLRPQ